MESPHPTCPHCSQPVLTTHSYCTSCGYPLNGNEQAVKDFKLKAYEQSQEKEENEKYIRNGTITLFVISGLFVLGAFVVYAITKDMAELILHGVFALVFLGLGFLSRKNAFGALLIGTILYSMYLLLAFIADPANIIKGILVKILVFLSLGRALRGALRMRKQNPEIHTGDNANS